MIRRKRPPDPPARPPLPDPLLSLALSWRGRATELNLRSLRIGTHASQRALNGAAAQAWMTAARELEAEVRRS